MNINMAMVISEGSPTLPTPQLTTLSVHRSLPHFLFQGLSFLFQSLFPFPKSLSFYKASLSFSKVSQSFSKVSLTEDHVFCFCFAVPDYMLVLIISQSTLLTSSLFRSRSRSSRYEMESGDQQVEILI